MFSGYYGRKKRDLFQKGNRSVLRLVRKTYPTQNFVICTTTAQIQQNLRYVCIHSCFPKAPIPVRTIKTCNVGQDLN